MNCWGILWSPAVGKIMAEVLISGKTLLADLRPFSPTRFMSKGAQGRGRKMVDAPVGEQW